MLRFLSSTPILAFVCQPQTVGQCIPVTDCWESAKSWRVAIKTQKGRLDVLDQSQAKASDLTWLRGGIIWEGRGGWRSGMYSSLTVNVINHKEMMKLWTAFIKWSAEREGDLIRQGKLIESLSCSLFIKMIYFAEFHSRFIQVETILSIYLSHCPITKTTTTSNIVSYLIDH